jgi:VanZ family protein
LTLFYKQSFIKLSQGLFWVSLLVITGLSLMPSAAGDMFFPYQDKLAHGLAYCYLYSLGWFALCPREISTLSSRPPLVIIRLLGLLVLYGAAIEFLQGLSGYRSRELADFFANCTGILCGLLLVRWYCGNFRVFA